ncbi:hypothetical protein EKN56_04675 [Limnobaculum zhutongyuii]|uniref:Uncharacterized protein n=1 Tax=Limnobaculum zhutongyuii TaxID=2498113 RepID=A0A411WHP4_9GAMM|nr:DUF6731 family protein [Limnobaculum zhutongyuii]QBH95755.1 hypothetical protein EKN56_04675 [Limnobaculum zhutongyuii]TQS86138.1 hypothetical protein ELQ32_20335 [Limnobaculum zhutongyuii]
MVNSASSERKYKIEFFQLDMTITADYPSPWEVFSAITEEGAETSLNSGGITRDIWGLRDRNRPLSFVGEFRKFRTTDVPEIGEVGSPAEDIELDENEGIIEKNFFVYYRNHRLLGWHNNSHAGGAKHLATFLSNLLGIKVKLNPVLKTDAIRRLMNGNTTVKKISVSIPRPTNPELYPDDDFGRQTIDMMDHMSADSLRLELGINSRRGDSAGALADRIKQALRAFASSGATTAKAQVIEDGIEYPIDLIADRIISFQSVETNARFPPSGTMYRLIDDAKRDCQEDIDGYFGTLENALT